MDQTKYRQILAKSPTSYKPSQYGFILYDKFGEQVAIIDDETVANNLISDVNKNQELKDSYRERYAGNSTVTLSPQEFQKYKESIFGNTK